MDNRKWEADAIASPPAVPTSPSSGYPTNGNPAAAQNATEPGAWWFHAVGEELRNVIEAGGLTPDIDDLMQLQSAIAAQIEANIQAVPDASETVKGVVELATDAEAQAFAANKFIDGAKLSSAFKGGNQLLAASGYQKFPGGLIVQWGVVNAVVGVGDNANIVTLPIAYPNNIFQVYASANDLSIAEADGVAVGARKITASLTTINVINTGTSTEPVSWLTIGK